MNTAHQVTIIVPIYADWPSLNDCLDSLRIHVDTRIHRILLVNDNGPEANALEEEIKQKITDWKNCEYVRNKKNLGFLANCNHAVLDLDKTSNDILLLNSDTRVTAGFLDEMLAVLHGEEKLAAVSPRSNNASIATIPLWAAIQKGIDPEKSYQLYKYISPRLPRYTTAPVVHGFCMLIRRDCIKKYGLFDPIFGKGYGEEVDFCLRLAVSGWRVAFCNWAYVFHLEARSFGGEQKQRLIEEHNQIIWARYPNYRQAVRDYMDYEVSFEQSLEPKSPLLIRARRFATTMIHSNATLHRVARRVHLLLLRKAK